ncbi:MAG: hypothetical protein MUF68_09025 [Cyclobacteriaceae bacterium]|nr:hypothetical protein [Cyclobacteriaceae bacterium]
MPAVFSTEALLPLPDWSAQTSTNEPEVVIPASLLSQSTLIGWLLTPVAFPTPPGPV